jgi:hypothetical protein
MHWPATFGLERISLIEDLSKRTGYSELDLCRALRGLSVSELHSLTHALNKPEVRSELDQRVNKASQR